MHQEVKSYLKKKGLTNLELIVNGIFRRDCHDTMGSEFISELDFFFVLPFYSAGILFEKSKYWWYQRGAGIYM